jgi:hypothetical protein
MNPGEVTVIGFWKIELKTNSVTVTNLQDAGHRGRRCMELEVIGEHTQKALGRLLRHAQADPWADSSSMSHALDGIDYDYGTVPAETLTPVTPPKEVADAIAEYQAVLDSIE